MANWDPVAEGDTNTIPDVELAANQIYRLTLGFEIPAIWVDDATAWAKVFGVGLSVENGSTILTFST